MASASGAWPRVIKVTISRFSRLVLATNVGHLDFSVLRGLFGADFGVAIGAALPHRGDFIADRVVSRPRAHERFQVVAGLSEEAGVEAAVGRKAHAIAARAERLRHRGDDADLAGAVAVAPALGHLAG